MTKKELFGKHYNTLLFEAILKAVLVGLLIGSVVNFLVALAVWIFDIGGIWNAIVPGAAVALISGTIFYFTKFRPKDNEIARRVDRLGLEERMVTMLELREDESLVAELQRQDAKHRLDALSGKRVKIHISKLVSVFTAVAVLLGAAMTTVVALVQNDIIPSMPDIVDPEDPMSQYVSVSYIVEEGGEIIGEADQILAPGGNATTVVAMPEDGWMFWGWDDGYDEPERTDVNITENLEFVAIFVELTEGEIPEAGEGSGDDGAPTDGEGDEASDAPTGGGEGNSDNEGSTESDADSEGRDDNENGDQDGSGGQSSEGNSGADGSGGGGKWEDSNQFIDGNTYYKDQLELYYEWAKEIFEQNGEIPPELREFFEKYFDSL